MSRSFACSEENGEDSSDQDRRTARAEQFLSPGRCIRFERGTFVDFPRRKRRRFVRKHLVSRNSASLVSNCPHFSFLVVLHLSLRSSKKRLNQIISPYVYVYNTYAYINGHYIQYRVSTYKVSMYPDPRVKTKFMQCVNGV